MIRPIALVLTVLTGFSGLVYEVAWQKYLATLLGSHSEATAAVLGIFLGGLSVGYWLFGRVTRGFVSRAETRGVPPRLLLLYGAVEGGIGVYVIAFPWLFRAVQAFSYSIPHGAVGFGFAVDVLLATLLIGPASVLMGGTIPILTQALARSIEDATRFHAFVYAFNTAGAFAGALAAGFYLIPTLGLERVMLSMGLINLGAGALFLLLGTRARAVVSLQQQLEDGEGAATEGFATYALIAGLTGFAMMAMQTTVIRVGVLSFGASQFTFSMVVAVFVLAIALGSFVVSAFSRIPPWVVWANQWGIALLFLLLYLKLDEAPYWVMLLRVLFRESDAGFAAYYFVGLLALLLVIGPPVLLSGAALPLLFHHLRRRVGHLGDLAGTLYSWNTLGSLLGALLAGYVLLFWLDLHHVYRLAIGALVVAAALLTVRVREMKSMTAAWAAPVLLLVAVLPAWTPKLLYAGHFRERAPGAALYEGANAFVQDRDVKRTIVWYDDGPTLSVLVEDGKDPQKKKSRGIQTDGKGDGDTVGDFDTAALAALLPAIMAEKAENAFLIGWGIGITAGELASLDSMQEVVVAEISHEVIDAAPLFDFATRSASKSPKVKVIEADAYRALMRQDSTYDVIISAPSHLWVTGVEMLFSREFLQAARDRLSPGGVHCQYIHRYENDDETVELVLRTYASVYEHVAVWQDRHGSMYLLGFQDLRDAEDLYRLEQRASRPDFRAALERMQIKGVPALLSHELLPVGVVNALSLQGPVHTLHHPRLNNRAARAFFRNDSGSPPFTGFGTPARLGRENSLLGRYAARSAQAMSDEDRRYAVFETCNSLGPLCNTLLAKWLADRPDAPDFKEAYVPVKQHMKGLDRERLEEVAVLFESPPVIPSLEPVSPQRAQRALEDFVEYYHHAAPFEPEALRDLWSRCRSSSPAGGRTCEDGQLEVRRLLDEGEVPPRLSTAIELRSGSPGG